MAFNLDIKGELTYLNKPEYLPIFLTYALEKNPNKFLLNYNKLLKIKGGKVKETNWREVFKKRMGTLPKSIFKDENLDWIHLQKLLLEDLKIKINQFKINWVDYLTKIKRLQSYLTKEIENKKIHKKTRELLKQERLGVINAKLKIKLISTELETFFEKISHYKYDESTSLAFKNYIVEYLTPRRYLIIDNEISFYDLLMNGIDFYSTYNLISSSKNQELKEYFKLFEESKELIKLNQLNDLKIDKIEQEQIMKEAEDYNKFKELHYEDARKQIEKYANASDEVRKQIVKEPPLYENVVAEYERRCLDDEDYAYIETCREIKEQNKKDIKNKRLLINKNQRKNTQKTIKRNRK
ncbi:MAG: hypothetical protein KJ771_01460 [Nanoarchaeota archaeon]|nr:hypothetical protein [Nanoarchaeota archaeon]